ncbi:ubiquinol-cytochrome c reductase iron-sulfur subunit [Nocardioides sp.]|uniref:cytochrome bc1 complex Rieske iron-sulfur subunit n=1 Tax=Nocardioides sp. TaxID=35761 RepID=UPI0027352A07|nr:Rieske 2Fe-2S domain-containing protein [Nocardioides sp.]MDP3891610.1 Rieske 2Fe-2S domain-containing protein [Nocardioides sp.]
MSTHSDTQAENLPATADPIADPGLPAHRWRPTDVDPKAEKRAERQVAGLFIGSMVFAVLFVVAYFAIAIGEDLDLLFGVWGASNAALGFTLGMALLLIGVGVIQWARKLMSDVEIVEMRHPAASPPEDREETLAALSAGLEESGLGRRPLIRNTLLGSMALLGLPAVVALRDLHPGDLDPSVLERTVWQPGLRVVNDTSGVPLRPEDLEIGQLVNAEPEGLVHPPGAEKHEEDHSDRPAPIQEYLAEAAAYSHSEQLNQMAKAAVILVRMPPRDITFSEKSPENWAVDGIVCYSKICTHVGCPIALWERKSHHLLCPCHQSTFDLADAGRVVFGPAARALPQLPLMVDDEGYLVAQSDFLEPVGPSYWERG